ncbi:MAG: protein-tyrosine-phosphatase [Bacteroidota bacterium]
MIERPNVLVVCGRNKRRSRTAEYIFKNDIRFQVRSVGVSPKSERQINAKDIIWSDLILVMDQNQKTRIIKTYRQQQLPKVVILDVDDIYEYQQPELVEILTERINDTVNKVFGL